MRKLVASLFMSLDGVIEEPAWTAPYWSDDIAKFKFAELEASDALLLGRKTYEGFAQAWPTQEHAGAMLSAFAALPHPQRLSEKMNRMPKFVATRTRTMLTWGNAHALEGDLLEAVQQLKRQPGGPLLTAGSASVVNTLLQHGLLDELHLLVCPVVLGRGQRLFEAGRSATLSLAEMRRLTPEVVHLCYRAGAAPA